jgi:hypothetical protein
MGADEITVGIVSWYSTQFIVGLLQSLSDKAVSSALEFVICDNTNGRDASLYEMLDGVCEIIPYDPVIPQVRQRKRAWGSYAHGFGLNMLLSRVNTEFCLFIDPDCLILTKGWDVACRAALTDGRYIAVGAPYHSSKIPKYHNFPSPIFVFFKTEAFRTIEADWTPYMLPLIIHVRDQILRVMAIPAGRLGERVVGRSFYAGKVAEWMRGVLGNSSKDTGWRIPGKARQHGYFARLFTPAVATHQLDARCAREPAIVELMNEFELYLWQSVPLVTHYYGARHRSKGNVVETTHRWRTLAKSAADVCSSIDIRALLPPVSYSDTIYL